MIKPTIMETLKKKGGVKMAQVSNDTTIGEALFMNPELHQSFRKLECIALDDQLLRESLWQRLQWFMV